MVGTPGCGLIGVESQGRMQLGGRRRVGSESPDTPETRDVDQSQALTSTGRFAGPRVGWAGRRHKLDGVDVIGPIGPPSV